MRAAVTVTPEALACLCTVAREAGRRIRRLEGHAGAARQKADRSPVTSADLAAQQAISSALSAWDATIPIVTEEADAAGVDERLRWDRWWLVDPLDGTKEFLSGNGEYTVNIALMHEGEPVLGVVHAPALDLMYCAGQGLGAWRQQGAGRAERITSREWRPGDPARVVESRSHPSQELEAYLSTLRIVERIRLGSSLKFCRVAEGAADLYPRFGPMMEWDVAAGDCVYRNSARVGERRSPLRYNTADLRVPGFVLGADVN